MDTLNAVDAHGLRYYLATVSALDRYFKQDSNHNTYVIVEASLIDLAKSLGELEYPGLDSWDAAVRAGEGAVYFRCIEGDDERSSESFSPLSFLYDPQRDAFLDREDAYYTIRSAELEPATGVREPLRTVSDAAVLAARYRYRIDPGALPTVRTSSELDPEFQRQLLIDILTGPAPYDGLALLHRSGFVDRFWSILAPMNSTDHSKEFHPEGNVWDHTLETMRYRKTPDLAVGMALLLHDVGKPYASPTREHRFDAHANIGEKKAREFLRGLGFSERFTERVAWLVRHHMMPGAIHKLPFSRSKHVMRSEDFPLLLELYRCDLSSTYQGPENYYRACTAYRQFLKHYHNPFRTAEGKKLVQTFVE